MRPPQRTQIASGVPAIGVDAAVVPVGLRPDGALDAPTFGLAGWYELGPRPGEPGPAVIAAHVDSVDGPDVFFRLREITAGDVVVVEHGHGATRFVVQRIEQTPKDHLPVDRIWASTGEAVLRLITCGGVFDRVRRSYTDNVVVYARSARTGQLPP